MARSFLNFSLFSELDNEPIIFGQYLLCFAKLGRIKEMINAWKVARNDAKQHHLLNIIAWNIVIDGLGENGQGREALHIFNEMSVSDIRPDEITFTITLNACSHAGLVSEAKSILERMSSEFKIEPNVKHRTCLVDALSRTGKLQEAFDLACKEKPLNVVSLMSVLSACRSYNNLKMAELTYKKLRKIAKNSDHLISAEVVMGQIYEKHGLSSKRMSLRIKR